MCSPLRAGALAPVDRAVPPPNPVGPPLFWARPRDAAPCRRRGTARPAPGRRRRRQRKGTRSPRQVLRPELFPCGGSFNGRVPACFLDGLRSPKGRGRGPGAQTRGGGRGARAAAIAESFPIPGPARRDVNRPPSKSTCSRAPAGMPPYNCPPTPTPFSPATASPFWLKLFRPSSSSS